MRMLSFGSKHAVGWLKYGQAHVWITFALAFLGFLAAVAALIIVIH